MICGATKWTLDLHAVVNIFGPITGTAFEEIVVGFDIRREVKDFAGFQLPGVIEHDLSTVMIRAFKVTGQPHVDDIFAAFGSVGCRDLIFGKDRRKRTFGDTRAAVNTRIGVNVNPGPFADGLARYHTFDGANVNAAAVTNA